ncbi:MAG TPA: efflux RND transporter periplasmic adaptor subunit [Rhizobacter sp.]|nr:efflux RND transporter periplasmic adaptor subunit [Rhizobacter sp.]
MKILHTVVAIVGISVASGAAWWYQNRTPAAGPATSTAGSQQAGANGPVVVEVGRAEAITIDDDAQGVGALRSRQGVMLRPEVSGRISRLGFNDGQRVRRGQMLVQLDDTLQAAQTLQAEAQASIARTNLQRNRELLAANFVSQSVVDQSVAALQVADAQVSLAKAQLARMRIDAPFDGVAGIRSVNVGDYVKDGADLVNVEDLSSVLLDFRVAERYVSRIKTGQPIEAQLDALPGKLFKGQVDAVDSLLDANGRSLLVRARLPNPGGELRSGMFARTRVVFASRTNAIVVPEEALVPLAGKQYLVKVVDGPDGTKVSQRLEAQIGMRLPGKVEIVQGLARGDVVVTAGHTRLLRPEALPVKIVNIDRPARPAGAAASGAASGVSRAGALAPA